MSDPTPAETNVLQPNLSLVLERITDGFFALDAEWRIAYMNSEARRLLDAQQNALGRFWLDAFPKARGRLFEREYQRAMREQMPVAFVEYSTTADCWFEVKAYPSHDGISVYFRDVTQRVVAQHELERNTRRQQALIDFGRAALGGAAYSLLLDDAVAMLDTIIETPIVEIFDYERASRHFSIRSAIGWREHASCDSKQPPILPVLTAVLSGEAFVCSDVRIEPRARSLAALAGSDVLACACVLIGTPAQPVGAVAVYSAQVRTFSVGEIRFVESIAQVLAEAATAHESDRVMAQVLESIRDAFVAVDRDLRITYVNARMANLWRRAASDMIGMLLADATREFGDGGRALEFFRSAIEHDRPVTFESRISERWYEIRLYPFSSGVAGYVQDITSRKEEEKRVLDINAELEHRVAERTLQLEHANKELEAFSYSVSHDLRAPLRAIDGFSQALVEDYNALLDDRARNYLDRVRKAAQRMADLIDALLGLTRVARVTMNWSRIDLSEMAEAILADLRENEPTREIETVVRTGLVTAGEPHLLRAALENLLNNAWKFTRDTRSARIEVGITAEGKEFFVRDNGAGFEMAYQNKLFGAFQRLHSAEEYEGTGIGLATVARILHRHGGSIRAEGAVGMGATFYFELPAHADGPA